MLMYWSESSRGGILEVPGEHADEEEAAGGDCEKLAGRISGHGLPDSWTLRSNDSRTTISSSFHNLRQSQGMSDQ